MGTKPPLNIPVVKRESPTTEIGAPGLKIFGGFLQEEFVTELQGQRGAQRYREMVDNCPCVDAALTTLKNASMRAIQDGRVEPFDPEKGERKPGEEGGAKREDEERAETVEQALEDMAHSRSDMDSEALSMYEYGYAPLEIVYKRRGGFKRNEEQNSRFNDELVGWSKVRLRAQESVLRWEVDEYGRKVTGLVQLPAPSYNEFFIPIERLALFRTTSMKGNPEGRSLLRAAYFAWKFFKRGTTVAWVGAERDVTGIPVLKGPADLFQASPTTEQGNSLARLKQIGENVRNDEQSCVVIPSDLDPETKAPLYSFELLSSPGTKTMDVPAMTRDQERQILMVLFSDFLLMGHEKIGTQALFSGRMGLYAMQLDALLDRYDEVLNRQMIPRLALLNGWPMDRLPQYKHGSVSEAAMAELGAFLQQYTAAGGIMDPDLDAYVREQVGWPAASPEALDLMMNPPTPPAFGEPPEGDPEEGADEVDGAEEEDEPDEVEEEGDMAKGFRQILKGDRPTDFAKALVHLMEQSNKNADAANKNAQASDENARALHEVVKVLLQHSQPVVNVAAAPPVITVDVPAPVVNVDVAAPMVKVEAPKVHIAPPAVTVQAPNVTIAAKEGPQEMKIVSMPGRKSRTTATVKRDGFGHITDTETNTIETDKE